MQQAVQDRAAAQRLAGQYPDIFFLLPDGVTYFDPVNALSPDLIAALNQALTDHQLVKIRFGDGNEVKPDAPERYTVRFDQAGRATIQADCNRASGGYTVEGPGLSFSAFATTRMACPPGSLSDRFLMQLGFVRSWGYIGEHLALVSLVDGSVLEFR